LYNAVCQGHEEMALYLMDNGADPNISIPASC